MSLDGLRAWIGVVERKLTMRTRVFLVLVAIAVGGAGAGIYLAIDANDKAVSEAELQSVRDELAGNVAATGGGDVTQLEAEVKALQAEVATLRSEQGGGEKGGGSSQESGNGASRESGGSDTKGTNGGLTPQQQKLKELVESSGDKSGK